jgi:hypothetical protein
MLFFNTADPSFSCYIGSKLSFDSAKQQAIVTESLPLKESLIG